VASKYQNDPAPQVFDFDPHILGQGAETEKRLDAISHETLQCQGLVTQIQQAEVEQNPGVNGILTQSSVQSHLLQSMQAACQDPILHCHGYG